MSYTLFSLTDARLPAPEQAFLTDDSREILRFAVEALMSGKSAALITLIEVRGGAARAPGAQMVVRDDGQYCGFVSGGCVESAAALEALGVMATGVDRNVCYGEGSPWFDIVLPCGGGITLAIHTLRSVQPLLAVLNRLEQRQPAGLRYVPQTQTLTCLATHTHTRWHDDGMEVGYQPGVRLVIFGQSLEAQITADLAGASGYEITATAAFPGQNAPDIDADTAVILLCHDLHREIPVLEAARNANPFYIGALGSQRTHDRRIKKLRELGWNQQEINRIKAPIGIFPKARDARTLALSILADVAATRLNQEGA